MCIWTQEGEDSQIDMKLQPLCSSMRGWSTLTQEWKGLVNISAGVKLIGQPFCRSVKDWSAFLQE